MNLYTVAQARRALAINNATKPVSARGHRRLASGKASARQVAAIRAANVRAASR